LQAFRQAGRPLGNHDGGESILRLFRYQGGVKALESREQRAATRPQRLVGPWVGFSRQDALVARTYPVSFLEARSGQGVVRGSYSSAPFHVTRAAEAEGRASHAVECNVQDCAHDTWLRVWKWCARTVDEIGRRPSEGVRRCAYPAKIDYRGRAIAKLQLSTARLACLLPRLSDVR